MPTLPSQLRLTQRVTRRLSLAAVSLPDLELYFFLNSFSVPSFHEGSFFSLLLPPSPFQLFSRFPTHSPPLVNTSSNLNLFFLKLFLLLNFVVFEVNNKMFFESHNNLCFLIYILSLSINLSLSLRLNQTQTSCRPLEQQRQPQSQTGKQRFSD